MVSVGTFKRTPDMSGIQAGRAHTTGAFTLIYFVSSQLIFERIGSRKLEENFIGPR
jgi:hypothetical protein